MVINIPLIDGWRIKSDTHQYILVKEDGKRESYEGYYSSIEGCVGALVEKKIRGFHATSVFGLINSIKSLQEALSKAIRPLKLVVVPLNQTKLGDGDGRN